MWSFLGGYERDAVIVSYLIAMVIHTLAYLYLIVKIWRSKNCEGISVKTHILYALVYTTRFLENGEEIFKYNPFMSIGFGLDTVFLLLAITTAISLYVFCRKTQERHQYDTFRATKLIICCVALTCLLNGDSHWPKIFSAFSYYLEVVAILPQLHVISRSGQAHTHVFRFLVGLTLSKALHLPLCSGLEVMRFNMDKLTVASAVVQLVICLDFFARRGNLSSCRIGGDDPEIASVDPRTRRSSGECLRVNMRDLVDDPSK